MFLDSITGTILFTLAILVIAIPIFNLFYKRWGYDYHTKIQNYLRNEGLSFSKKKKPKKSDWMRGLFRKPSAVTFWAGHISVLGFRTSWSDTSYWIIETNQGVNVWLELETTFLLKPALTYRKEELQVLPRTDKELEGKTFYNYPGCQYVVLESDENCPDCGLHLVEKN